MNSNPFYDAFRVLSKVYQEGAHLKIAMSSVDMDPKGKAHTVKTCYGVLENDGYLSLCIRAFAPKSPKAPVRVLLKIALYHLIYLKKPRYMVTFEAVDLLKRMGKGGAAGFVNAFLRAFDEEGVTLPQNEDERLSLLSDFPLFAVKMAREEYGPRAEKILLAKSRGVSVRFERGEEGYLNRPHIETPFKHLYIFENFARDEGFERGDYTFQSVGSVAIADAVEPCENFFDACAAPGGKSVLIAKKCKTVLSEELYPHRAELIKGYFTRMRTQNAKVLIGDARTFLPEMEEKFEGVLCDVPCSGFGTVCENPDLPLNKREEDFFSLLPVQREILKNCARYVKKGGALYYSTCSVFHAENDGAVEEFLKENNTFEAEEVASPLAHNKAKFGICFLPDEALGAGFYLSKLRKKSS